MHSLEYLLFLLLAFHSTTAMAQTVLNLTPGDRIRVTLVTDREPALDWAPRTPFIGEFERYHSDHVSMIRNGTSVQIPTTSISLMEVSRGTQTQSRRGAAIGAAVGAIAAGIAAYSSSEGCTDYRYCILNDDTPAAAGVAVGVVGGGLLGLAVGSLIRTSHWVKVEIPIVNNVFSDHSESRRVSLGLTRHRRR
jgi:hypothetical protein